MIAEAGVNHNGDVDLAMKLVANSPVIMGSTSSGLIEAASFMLPLEFRQPSNGLENRYARGQADSPLVKRPKTVGLHGALARRRFQGLVPTAAAI